MQPKNILCTCAHGFEAFLIRELTDGHYHAHHNSAGLVSGIVHEEMSTEREFDLCFARTVLINPHTENFTSYQDAAQKIVSYFLEQIKTLRIDSSWTISVQSATPHVSDDRCRAITDSVLKQLKKAVSRIVKFAITEIFPQSGTHSGLCVLITDENTLSVSRDFWAGGQCRMQMIPGAPSRSFLKIEEAYRIARTGPSHDQVVVDLGAAPGGWSFSAANRGAFIYAVDNGPLKDGAHNNDSIQHETTDAFIYSAQSTAVDWLFCDMVEDPEKVLVLIRKWFSKGWCRNAIFNLKFGRTDPLRILSQVKDSEKGISSFAHLIIRHLYHDREEFTVIALVE